jgi:hypothetical protein
MLRWADLPDHPAGRACLYRCLPGAFLNREPINRGSRAGKPQETFISASRLVRPGCAIIDEQVPVSMWTRLLWPPAFVAGALLLCIRPAGAQDVPRLRRSAVEVSVGVTLNAVVPDVNTAPHCLQLALPCTHERSDRFSGFGLTLGIARPLSDRLAIAGEISTFRTRWDDSAPAQAVVPASTRVTSFFAGPRISTAFFTPGAHDPSPGRFFGHVLVGGETSGVVPLRPATLVGGGADFAIPMAAQGAPGTRPVLFRWSFDYRLSPGARRSFSGYRFGFGVLFGPTVR